MDENKINNNQRLYGVIHPQHLQAQNVSSQLKNELQKLTFINN